MDIKAAPGPAESHTATRGLRKELIKKSQGELSLPGMVVKVRGTGLGLGRRKDPKCFHLGVPCLCLVGSCGEEGGGWPYIQSIVPTKRLCLYTM